MNAKTCTKCWQERDLSLFYKIKNKFSWWCKICFRAYGRERYAMNPEVRAKARVYNRSRRKKQKCAYKSHSREVHKKEQLTIFLEDVKVRRKNLAAFLENIKSKPCTDCGKKYPPWIMDFDHLPGSTKTSNVSTLVLACKPIDVILQEIAKCELVCSNCHRQRTHRRKTSPNSLLPGLPDPLTDYDYEY